ncbi:hypothetical protein QFC21_005905 [Naganishia friedmannii]|uniref:Uncharacterized protein n=1 Tax=Naganishia friedmannii TaxID=89922 RepID=A0ACC2V648_9TREE|nr:hypothetical protein QFC21_005905 [Naganishia friedmannii]
MPKASSKATKSERNAVPGTSAQSGTQVDPPPPAKKPRPAPVRRGKGKKTPATPAVGQAPLTPELQLPPSTSPAATPPIQPAIAHPVRPGEWVPAPLRSVASVSSPSVTLHSVMQDHASQAASHSPSVPASDIDKDFRIAELLARNEFLERDNRAKDASKVAAEASRAAAEKKARDLQRRAHQDRLDQLARTLAPIPRPSRPRKATWVWARMEEILGLAPAIDKDDNSFVKKARVTIYHWILHTSRWVLQKAHREFGVDIGASFKKLKQTQWKAMIDSNKNIDMEGLGFRDALKRPKVYANEARKLLEAAKAAKETAGILNSSVVRYDQAGAPLRDLYGVTHQSDDDTASEEEDTEEGGQRLAAQAGELSEKRKQQLEKEDAEKERLHVGDTSYYNLEDEAEAIQAVHEQVLHEDDEPGLEEVAPSVEA